MCQHKQDVILLKAWLGKWAAWRTRAETAYLSPPNMIYKLMHGEPIGGGFGACEPRCAKVVMTDSRLVQLDAAISQLTDARQRAIYCEYFVHGDQKAKAAALGMTVDGYRKNFYSAIKQLLNMDSVKKLVKVD